MHFWCSDNHHVSDCVGHDTLSVREEVYYYARTIGSARSTRVTIVSTLVTIGIACRENHVQVVELSPLIPMKGSCHLSICALHITIYIHIVHIVKQFIAIISISCSLKFQNVEKISIVRVIKKTEQPYRHHH